MIAILQLWREKTRFVIGICGVAFATILILMQFGFQGALFDSSTQLHEAMRGELFLIDRKTSSLVSCRQFPKSRLIEALRDPSVESVQPLYIARASCRAQGKLQTRPIFVVAVEPTSTIFAYPDVSRLSNEQSVLFDEKSRKEFGNAATGTWLRLENRRLKVAGTFRLGTSFGADGNVIMSTTTFMKLFPTRRNSAPDIGVIQLKTRGADWEARPYADVVKARLQKMLPSDVRVLTKAEFVSFEQNYWRTSTAIGFIFRMGIALSVVVGAIIVYQILYADINDHLREYATLLAMGYSMGFLYDAVFVKAVVLAVTGFIPGVLVALHLYHYTAANTGLPLNMAISRAVLTLALSIAMCCLAAVFSSMRLRQADPADVFSGG